MATVAQLKLSSNESRRKSSIFPKLIFYKGRSDSIAHSLLGKTAVSKNRRLSVENNRRVVKHLRRRLDSIREERNTALKAIPEIDVAEESGDDDEEDKHMKKSDPSTPASPRHEARPFLPVGRVNGLVFGNGPKIKGTHAEYYFNSDQHLPTIIVGDHEASVCSESDKASGVSRRGSTPGIFVDWKSDSEEDHGDDHDSEEEFGHVRDVLSSTNGWNRKQRNGLGELSEEKYEKEAYLMDFNADFSMRRRKMKIFVCGGPEMYRERLLFQTNVFPRLSNLARSNSLSLEITDLEDRENFIGDYQTVATRHIKDAVEESAGTAFVGFLSDDDQVKVLPPSSVPYEIMTKINSLLQLEIVTCEASIYCLSTNLSNEVDDSKDKIDLPKKVRFSEDEAAVTEPKRQNPVRILRKRIRQCQKSQRVLKRHYEIDRNVVPVCFVLRKTTASSGANAKYLLDVMQKYLWRIQHDEEARNWTSTYIHPDRTTDVLSTLQMSKKPKSSCLIFYRTVQQQNRSGDTRLNTLRAKLGHNGVRRFNMTTNEMSKFKAGKTAKLCGSNSNYLEKLEFDLYNAVSLQINNWSENADKERSITEDIVKEHLKFGQNLCKGFIGRESALQEIRKYIISEYERVPLAVFGDAGCGLSSVMSVAAAHAKNWIRNRSSLPDIRFRRQNRDTVVIFRSVAVTAESKSVKQIIFDICSQLKKIENLVNDEEESPDNEEMTLGSVQHMATLLKDSLLRVVQNKAIIVVFIDNLNAAHGVKGKYTLSWIPKPLPKFVKIILSFTTDSSTISCGLEPENMKEAYLKLHKEKGKTVRVQKLFLRESLSPRLTNDATRAKEILRSYLQRCKRKVTDKQSSIILEAAKNVLSPLALELLAQIAISWNSFTSEKQCIQDTKNWGNNLKEFCASFLSNISSRFDAKFCRSVLCFLTCSRNGLTHEEIVELVARDRRFITGTSAVLNPKPVMTTSKTSKRPPRRYTIKYKASTSDRCQTVLRINAMLYQFLADLLPFLMETMSDNVTTLKWAHGVFFDAVQAMYVDTPQHFRYYHRIMLSYFSNKHEECRCGQTHDCSQPLQWTSYGKATINSRRLNESIYHAMQCEDLDVIKSEMLFDIEWLQAKLKATSIESLMDEMYAILRMNKADNDVKLLTEALYLSHAILAHDPKQLPSQLLGRLHDTIERDIPSAPEDPRKYPYTRVLLSQIRRSNASFLMPTTTCLTSGTQVIYDPLQGHDDVITSITCCTDGQRIVTASKDSTIKIWDVIERRVLRTIENAGNDISAMCVCMGNYYVATIHKHNHVNVWNLLKCNKVLTVKDYLPDEEIAITVASEGQLLAIISKYSANARVWDLDKLLFHKDISIQPEKGKTPDLSVAKSGKGNYILIGYKGQSEAIVVNAKRGKISRTLACEKGRITQVEVSREYYIVGCRRRRMEVHELQHFYLFDGINFGLIRILKACADDTVFNIFVNRLGSHLIGLSANTHGVEEVVVWSTESDAHRHMVQSSKRHLGGTCTDLQYCMTAFESESVVRIHNLAAQISKHDHSRTQVRKKVDGIGRLFNMPKHEKYVVAQGTSGSPITIWNVARSRCRGEAVIIERGLLDKNDVVVIKDVMVVILSDRGMVTINHRSQQVFETIYVYNLLLRKYERKLHPVRVNMCNPNHYHLIGDNKLLLTSIDRTSLTVWSIVTGQVLYEIRPNFPSYPVEDKSKRKPTRRKRIKTISEKASIPDTVKKRTNWKKCRISEEDKQRAIFEMIVSRDDKTLICSYYSRHLVVFDLEKGTHTHTLSDRHSLLHLHKAIITPDGSYLLCTNYDGSVHSSYLTLWDLKEGCVTRRKKDEPKVCSVSMTDDASRVVFVTEDNYIKIWDPFKRHSHRSIAGYSRLDVRCPEGDDSQPTTIFVVSQGKRAILFANSISLWDLEAETLLMVFEPDTKFQCCTVVLEGRVIVVGRRDSPSITTLRVPTTGQFSILHEKDRFGETAESSDDSTITEDSDDQDG